MKKVISLILVFLLIISVSVSAVTFWCLDCKTQLGNGPCSKCREFTLPPICENCKSNNCYCHWLCKECNKFIPPNGCMMTQVCFDCSPYPICELCDGYEVDCLCCGNIKPICICETPTINKTLAILKHIVGMEMLSRKQQEILRCCGTAEDVTVVDALCILKSLVRLEC